MPHQGQFTIGLFDFTLIFRPYNTITVSNQRTATKKRRATSRERTTKKTTNLAGVPKWHSKLCVATWLLRQPSSNACWQETQDNKTRRLLRRLLLLSSPVPSQLLMGMGRTFSSFLDVSGPLFLLPSCVALGWQFYILIWCFCVALYTYVSLPKYYVFAYSLKSSVFFFCFFCYLVPLMTLKISYKHSLKDISPVVYVSWFSISKK